MLGFYPAREVHDAEQFVLGLATVFGGFSLQAGRKAISPLSGIPAKCKFLPGAADVVEFLEAEAKREHESRRYSTLSRREVIPTPKTGFCPYPRLWAALAGDMATLAILKSLTFDQMTRASKMFAVDGLETARGWIKSRGGLDA